MAKRLAARPRVALERVYKPKDPVANGIPIYIIDFRVALHAILPTVDQFAEASGIVAFSCDPDLPDEARSDLYFTWSDNVTQHSEWQNYLRAQWAVRLHRGPDMLPRASYRVVVVDDNKLNGQYWRHIDEPAYKGTRTKDKDRGIVYGQIRDAGHALVAEFGLPMYTQPLYEADDWAGVIHRAKLNASPGSLAYTRELYYGTVDSDWLQLVHDETRQLWANTGPWPSRLKNECETRAYILKREGQTITSPSEIALVKQRCGDSADNLQIGSALHLFDLVNPNPLYDLASTEGGLLLAAELDNPEANSRPDVLSKAARWLSSRWYPITVLD